MPVRWLCCGLALACLAAAPVDEKPFPPTEPADATPAALPATPLPAPPPPVTPLLPPRTPPIEPLAAPPWPQIAAVFPGVLVHGAGTWLQGRRLTTQRLLLLESASLFAIALGGIVIYETGAARDFAGAATLTIAAGVGGLSSSLLGSLYATWSPPRGWGAAQRRLPSLVSGLGYTYVSESPFDENHFMTAQVDGRLYGWHLGVDAIVSPTAGDEQLAARAGYRLLGPRAGREPAADGSYLEPQVGYSSQGFDRYGFVTRTAQVQIEGRLDVEHWLPDVRGAFFQASVGLARQWVEFDVPGTQATDASGILLLHSGFGVYVGARAPQAADATALPPGGEVELYYDHRRDGLTGGMKTSGPSSGFAGHVGLRAQYFVSEAWGLNGTLALGSTWVLGSSVLFRTGVP